MEALQHARNTKDTKDNKEMAYILSSLPAEFILEKRFISWCLLPVDINIINFVGILIPKKFNHSHGKSICLWSPCGDWPSEWALEVRQVLCQQLPWHRALSISAGSTCGNSLIFLDRKRRTGLDLFSTALSKKEQQGVKSVFPGQWFGRPFHHQLWGQSSAAW